MAIEVSVYSSENRKKQINAKKKSAKILTNSYVRQLNQGISYRISQSQSQNDVAVRKLTQRPFR